MKLSKAATVLIIMAVCAPIGKARAQHVVPMTLGSGFLRVCGPKVFSAEPSMRALKNRAEGANDAACNMYIFGIFEGIDSDADLLEGYDGKSHRFICIPHDVGAADMRDLVIRFIQNDPKFYADFKTSRIASLALSAAYPCQAVKSR